MSNLFQAVNRAATLTVAGLIVSGLLVPREVSAGDPCCAITAIDARAGVVTIVEKATRRVHRFTLDDLALALSLKVGQLVDVDFKTGKVTVRPNDQEPCCNVVAVDGRGGLTIVVKATGRKIDIPAVKIASRSTVKVGDAVDAEGEPSTTAVWNLAASGMLSN